MIQAPIFAGLNWLTHGFGLRDSILPVEIRTIKQIHSNIVRETPDYGDGDALISHEKGVLAGVKTADCVPILLVDPTTRAVAAIHAGWRGTVANIVGQTVRRLNAQPEDLLAAIGPSIGECCYEVGPEVAVQFGTHIDKNGPKKAHINIKRTNELLLRQAGVQKIWISDECTSCAPDRFFSWRRDHDPNGRMVSFIGRRS